MDESTESAPVFQVPEREVIAVEHPMIIQNVDNGIKTFGRNRPFQRIIGSRDAQDIIPLYLRYNDVLCTPILSHNSPTNNLLLKITVPKRIAKKRKRGSADPPQNEWIPLEEDDLDIERVQSHSRLDKPADLLRKLQDTKGKYKVEVAGEVKQSHRFRGLSDFQHSTGHTEFMTKFRDIAFANDVNKLRDFKFDLSRGVHPDFMPAPIMTSHQIPFNWGWHQNPNIFAAVDQATGQTKLINRSGGRKLNLEYLNQDVDYVPTAAHDSPPNDEGLLKLIADLKQALEKRPLYTRRALVNRVGSSKELFRFKDAIQYVGYQFRGGPFRDAVIRFGVDPRSDPKYRAYQTFFFKLFEEEEKVEGMQWKDVRTSYTINKRGATKEDRESHIFDGKNVILDGKIWQACDITDPLLARLIRDSPYRETCDNISDGWFPPGSMAKIRSIMKTKLMAVCCKRDLTDEDFESALRVPDYNPEKKSKSIQVPVPKVGLTHEEIEEMRKQGLTKAVQSSGVRKKPVKGKARSARIRSRVVHDKPLYKVGPKPVERPILPKPVPAAWSIPIDPALGDSDNLPASDRPLASIEEEGTPRRSIEDGINVDDVLDEDESGRSEDEGTDIENDEISDGAGSDRDSEETDVVDYGSLYGSRLSAQ